MNQPVPFENVINGKNLYWLAVIWPSIVMLFMLIPLTIVKALIILPAVFFIFLFGGLWLMTRTPEAYQVYDVLKVYFVGPETAQMIAANFWRVRAIPWLMSVALILAVNLFMAIIALATSEAVLRMIVFCNGPRPKVG